MNSLSWLDGDTLVAGCEDHSIKLVDIEKSYIIKQSILTSHKVPTCMDTSSRNLILTGSEDSTIRLWDCRTGSERPAKQMLHSYQGHQAWISSVQLNPQDENIFISGSLDGTARLWDIRNDEVPIANLKQKHGKPVDEFKVFSVEWNGSSQILSGGSDSHISVHTL